MLRALRGFSIVLPLLSGASFLGAVTCSNRALAQSDAETIRLAYSAPENCPSTTDLEARIRGAAPRVHIVSHDPSARLFTVQIDGKDTPHGQLSITKGETLLGTRDVVGATCDEVANILAFAVALAVDPNAVPLVPTSAPTPEPPPAVPHERAPAPPNTPVAPASPERGRTSWGFSAHAFGAPGLAPNMTFGAGISAEIAATMGALVPALRLGFEYGVSAPVASDGARVTFADALVLLDACPTTFEIGLFALRPCVRFDGGARTTASEDIPGAHSVTRPWLDVGPMIHLRFRVAEPLFVALEGGPLFPLLRDHVYFSPQITVHDVPVIAAHGEIALGIAFR